jgi:hypothetical protein
MKEPGIRLRVGLVFLILASVTRWLPRFGVDLPQDPLDAASGLMYGVAFGFMLLSLRRRQPRA